MDTVYTYDRADQLKTRQVGTGPVVDFAYDARGNMTSNAETGSTTTAYSYDWADRLTSIDPPGASNTVAFTFDALGRNRTRTVNGTLDLTYSYLGTTETVVRLAVNGGVTTNAALDALGQRIAVKAGDGSFFGWLLPDLHGNVAAALSQDEATVSDGLRYDAYGQLAAIYPTGGTGVSAKWRYQGRLLVSTSGNADLYDAGARSYSPGLAAFTQLDSVMGGAANPLSMNRYLYAEANPATPIDPDGHRVACVDECIRFGTIGSNATTSTTTTTVASSASPGCGPDGIYCHSAQGIASGQLMEWPTDRPRPTCDWPGCLPNYPGAGWVSRPAGPSQCEADLVGCLTFLVGGLFGGAAVPELAAAGVGVVETGAAWWGAGGLSGLCVWLCPKVPAAGEAALQASGAEPGVGSATAAAAAAGQVEHLAAQLRAMTPAELTVLVRREAQAVADQGLGALDRHLTEAQKAAAAVEQWRIWWYRGTIVHEEAAARLQARYGDLVEYSRIGPDFTFPGGIQVELTTVGSLARHQSRYDWLPVDQFATYSWR